MESVLTLLPEMISKEKLYLHQSQIRSVVHTAIQYDRFEDSKYGNGVRVFLKLRSLSQHKPDDVMYRMVIKSIIKRRKNFKEKLVAIDLKKENFTFGDSKSTVVLKGEEGEGDNDLKSIEALLYAMSEDGTKPSTLTSREILFFYFSRNETEKAKTYFRLIEKELEATGVAMHTSLAEMYLINMLQVVFVFGSLSFHS